MTEVTAAIILKDNKVLIAQRAPGENLAGWEFPGGKIEHGETPKECLKREIREELDVDIEVSDFFGESIYTYHSGTIKLMPFWCQWISGDFTLKVHSQAQDYILENIRNAVNTKRNLISKLHDFMEIKRELKVREFLEGYHVTPQDVFSKKVTVVGLAAQAGLLKGI